MTLFFFPWVCGQSSIFTFEIVLTKFDNRLIPAWTLFFALQLMTLYKSLWVETMAESASRGGHFRDGRGVSCEPSASHRSPVIIDLANAGTSCTGSLPMLTRLVQGCIREFATLQGMINHLQVHFTDAQKPFQCQEPGCNKRYVGQHNTTYHYNKHYRDRSRSSPLNVTRSIDIENDMNEYSETFRGYVELCNTHSLLQRSTSYSPFDGTGGIGIENDVNGSSEMKTPKSKGKETQAMTSPYKNPFPCYNFLIEIGQIGWIYKFGAL